MKGLNCFNHFDFAAFSSGKTLSALSCQPLSDEKAGIKSGSKVEVVILEDKTVYPTKNGKEIDNTYEKIRVKVRKVVDIPKGSYVELVNPVGTIYGDFRNNLSITCDDIKVVAGGG